MDFLDENEGNGGNTLGDGLRTNPLIQIFRSAGFGVGFERGEGEVAPPPSPL